MSMANRASFLLMTVLALCAVSSVVVHNVGDSAGWTIIGAVDYNQWASKEKFSVGDTLAFRYNPQFHNVIQVSENDYEACNAKSPIVTYTSGDDSITLTSAGHAYFICGIPGHCKKGQKVDISVDASSQNPSVPSLRVALKSRCHVPYRPRPRPRPNPPVVPSPPCIEPLCQPPNGNTLVGYIPFDAASDLSPRFSLLRLGFLAMLFATLAY